MDDPPPYEETPLQQQPQSNESSTANSSSSLTPPSDSQRAQPPMKIQKSNQSITGTFTIIDISSAKSPPDVFLKTTNSKIATSLWVEGGLPRPFAIEAATTNSQIDLSVHMISPSQPVSVTASTTNSSIRTLLPEAFHGILAISNRSGKHTLSAGLKNRLVLVSLDDPPIESGITYQIGGPGGESLAVLSTTNSSVSVGLTSDPKTDEGGCSIM